MQIRRLLRHQTDLTLYEGWSLRNNDRNVYGLTNGKPPQKLKRTARSAFTLCLWQRTALCREYETEKDQSISLYRQGAEESDPGNRTHTCTFHKHAKRAPSKRRIILTMTPRCVRIEPLKASKSGQYEKRWLMPVRFPFFYSLKKKKNTAALQWIVVTGLQFGVVFRPAVGILGW